MPPHWIGFAVIVLLIVVFEVATHKTKKRGNEALDAAVACSKRLADYKKPGGRC